MSSAEDLMQKTAWEKSKLVPISTESPTLSEYKLIPVQTEGTIRPCVMTILSTALQQALQGGKGEIKGQYGQMGVSTARWVLLRPALALQLRVICQDVVS